MIIVCIKVSWIYFCEIWILIFEGNLSFLSLLIVCLLGLIKIINFWKVLFLNCLCDFLLMWIDFKIVIIFFLVGSGIGLLNLVLFLVVNLIIFLVLKLVNEWLKFFILILILFMLFFLFINEFYFIKIF